MPTFKKNLLLVILFGGFFSTGILNFYPLNEIILLLLFLLTISSFLQLFIIALSLAVLFTFQDEYFLYNLLCVIVLLISTSQGDSVFKNSKEINNFLNMSFAFVIIHTFILIFQSKFGFLVNQNIVAFPGRGSGFRAEPSLSAGVVFFLLVINECKRKYYNQNHNILTLLLVVLIFLFSTSTSVLIVFLLFILYRLLKIRNRFIGAGMKVILVISIILFYLNFDYLFALGTENVGSWRSISDVSILLSYNKFIFPNINSSVRDRLSESVFLFSYDYNWLNQTYSLFSSAALILGLFFLVMFLLFKLKNYGLIVFPLFVIVLFVTPKYDIFSFISLYVLFKMKAIES